MSTIDEATQAFAAFFEAELKVLEANLSGAATFAKLHARMEAMLSEPAVFEIARLDVSKLKGMAKLAVENTKKEIAVRQLFLVEQHAIAKRTLYRAVASQPERAKHASTFAMAFWADDDLKIIATDLVCSTCRGRGKTARSKCRDCAGAGSLRKTGERIKAGKPKAIKKLARPSEPASAERYDEL